MNENMSKTVRINQEVVTSVEDVICAMGKTFQKVRDDANFTLTCKRTIIAKNVQLAFCRKILCFHLSCLNVNIYINIFCMEYTIKARAKLVKLIFDASTLALPVSAIYKSLFYSQWFLKEINIFFSNCAPGVAGCYWYRNN